MTNFLVTGVGGPAGRSLTALLLERKFNVVGTDMQPSAGTGFPFFQVPAANSPDLLRTIREIATREHTDWIIPTVSEELPVFASGWKEQDECPVLISSARAVGIANDKYLTARCLSGAGVSVPRFALPGQVHSPEEVAARVGWPCISKPRVGRGGREVALRTEKDWPAVKSLGDGYILQEFADGIDYAPNVYAEKDGGMIVVVLEKTELKEGIVGNAKQVRRVEAADVAELAAAAARTVGLTGPLDIDIRRRKDGTPVVLEINARFGANIRHAPEVLDAALRMGLAVS